MVWYVRDVVDGNNPAAGDTGGRPTPSRCWATSRRSVTDNDFIFVFPGNTGTTAAQRRHRDRQHRSQAPRRGHRPDSARLGTLVPPAAGRGSPTRRGRRPRGQRRHRPAMRSLAGIEIRGLSISGLDNAIDVTATGANGVRVTVSNTTVRSDARTASRASTSTPLDRHGDRDGHDQHPDLARQHGGRALQRRAGPSGSPSDSNAGIRSPANAVVIDGAAAGTTTITGFANNIVSAEHRRNRYQRQQLRPSTGRRLAHSSRCPAAPRRRNPGCRQRAGRGRGAHQRRRRPRFHGSRHFRRGWRWPPGDRNRSGQCRHRERNAGDGWRWCGNRRSDRRTGGRYQRRDD